jgi:hypothetical protein
MFVERKTQRFLDALRGATGPKIHELTPGEARRFWALTQAVDVVTLPADVEDLTVPGGPTGSVSIRIVRPPHHPDPSRPCSTFTAAGGCSATATPTIGWCEISRTAPAWRSYSWISPGLPRHSIRLPWNRRMPLLGGPRNTGTNTVSTQPASE